jgi:3'-phosphoadenosine 5'-phosphosulfate sulfotransferase (PAPS reductase)/FAD synthetase
MSRSNCAHSVSSLQGLQQTPLVLSFGGGTDSTAILAGWYERGLQQATPIKHIVFADTGGERPHTYQHIETMNGWLRDRGFPTITVVCARNKMKEPITLEGECLRKRTLPSLAFGFKTCSQRFKIAPFERWSNNEPELRALRRAGGKPTKLIGYEFRETRRWAGRALEDDKWFLRFPLVEWQWNREEALEAIARAGIPQPGKSSCFFCPASRLTDIDQLGEKNPDLLERALHMERVAMPSLGSVKGLGRRFNWNEYVTSRRADRPISEDEVCLTCVDGM